MGGESAPWINEAAGKDPYRFRANDMSCATCHHPAFGFADGRRLSAGVSRAQFADLDLGPARVVPGNSIISGTGLGIVPRNAPSIFNAAFNGLDSPTPRAKSFMFLDGRVTEGLEARAVLPITSRDEMAGDAYDGDSAQDSVTARIRAIPEYVARRGSGPGWSNPGSIDPAVGPDTGRSRRRRGLHEDDHGSRPTGSFGTGPDGCAGTRAQWIAASGDSHACGTGPLPDRGFDGAGHWRVMHRSEA